MKRHGANWMAERKRVGNGDRCVSRGVEGKLWRNESERAVMTLF